MSVGSQRVCVIGLALATSWCVPSVAHASDYGTAGEWTLIFLVVGTPPATLIALLAVWFVPSPRVLVRWWWRGVGACVAVVALAALFSPFGLFLVHIAVASLAVASGVGVSIAAWVHRRLRWEAVTGVVQWEGLDTLRYARDDREMLVHLAFDEDGRVDPACIDGWLPPHDEEAIAPEVRARIAAELDITLGNGA